MKYQIYQLDRSNKTVSEKRLLFSSWTEIKRTCPEYGSSLYRKVYENEMDDDRVFGERVTGILEQIFQKLNLSHPTDFLGHSLSVSDVVCIEYQNRKDFYFCDSFGWKKLKRFEEENNVTASVVL